MKILVESAVQDWTEDTRIYACWTLFGGCNSVKKINNYCFRCAGIGAVPWS
jgi:hypothetical protein